MFSSHCMNLRSKVNQSVKQAAVLSLGWRHTDEYILCSTRLYQIHITTDHARPVCLPGRKLCVQSFLFREQIFTNFSFPPAQLYPKIPSMSKLSPPSLPHYSRKNYSKLALPNFSTFHAFFKTTTILSQQLRCKTVNTKFLFYNIASIYVFYPSYYHG